MTQQPESPSYDRKGSLGLALRRRILTMQVAPGAATA